MTNVFFTVLLLGRHMCTSLLSEVYYRHKIMYTSWCYLRFIRDICVFMVLAEVYSIDYTRIRQASILMTIVPHIVNKYFLKEILCYSPTTHIVNNIIPRIPPQPSQFVYSKGLAI